MLSPGDSNIVRFKFIECLQNHQTIKHPQEYQFYYPFRNEALRQKHLKYFMYEEFFKGFSVYINGRSIKEPKNQD